MVVTILGRLLLALTLLVADPAVAAPPSRIVAVGDLHGDASVWQDIARAAGLVDPAGHWSGGRTTLVQMGDIVDRGPGSLQIIRSLRQLQREAPRAGGRVVVLAGNHEAMNVIGDLRYTDPGEFAAFADARSPQRRDRWFKDHEKAIEAAARASAGAAGGTLSAAAIRAAWIRATPLGYVEHRAAWMPGGELGKWTASLPAVARIGDTLFVHGGLSAEYSALTLDVINDRVRAAMAAGDDRETAIISDELGPLWYRGLVSRPSEAGSGAAPAAATPAKPPRPSMEEELELVLRTYGAKRIVVAHTPSLKGIVVASGGRLVRVDTGNSRFYNGQPSFLEIVGDQLVPHSVTRSAGGS